LGDLPIAVDDLGRLAFFVVGNGAGNTQWGFIGRDVFGLNDSVTGVVGEFAGEAWIDNLGRSVGGLPNSCSNAGQFHYISSLPPVG
jgi:hypothetical protein